VRFYKLAQFLEKQQRYPDSTDHNVEDPVQAHFLTVSWMYKENKERFLAKQLTMNKYLGAKDEEEDEHDENADTRFTGVEAPGDIEFCGKPNENRRRRCAAHWSFEYEKNNRVPGARSARDLKQSTGSKYNNINYNVLVYAIDQMKPVIDENLVTMTSRMARDDDLLHKAFIREIKVGYEKLHGNYVEAVKTIETGDLELAISNKLVAKSLQLENPTEEKKEDSVVDFTLKAHKKKVQIKGATNR